MAKCFATSLLATKCLLLTDQMKLQAWLLHQLDQPAQGLASKTLSVLTEQQHRHTVLPLIPANVCASLARPPQRAAKWSLLIEGVLGMPATRAGQLYGLEVFLIRLPPLPAAAVQFP